MEVIKHFDPELNSKGDKKEQVQVIWTTESVNKALEMVSLGKDLTRSPFFEGDIERKKGDLVFHMTKWEEEEWFKCASDILYFIDNYCKIKLPSGKIGLPTLRKYQLGGIIDIMENDEVIMGWSRQSGKTIGTVLYMLWVLMFQYDKQIAVLANKSKTSEEVLTKLQEIYRYLPFFLKAGVQGWNTKTVVFDNDCKIYTAPTTNDALNGRTCNILYIDEFAYIGKGKNKVEIQKDFFANATPILASQKDSGLCKLIISSTPFGKDFFYELFDDALKGKNGMKASIVRWWQIPNRNLEWAKKEIAKHGMTKFKQQFEVSFDVHSRTLLKPLTMKRLQKRAFEFEIMGDGVLSEYGEYFKLNPREEITENDFICLSVDIAEGLEKDYSTVQLLKMELDFQTGEIKFKQVGVFSCNTIPIDKFVLVVKELCQMFNEDNYKLLVEANTYGDYFFKCFDLEETIDVPMNNICFFKRNADAKSLSRGLRTNKAIKPVAVSTFKTFVDSDTLRVFEEDTIKEIENFQEDDKGNYCASIGHDDRVTPLINFCYWLSINDYAYQNWLEDYLESLGIEYELEED